MIVRTTPSTADQEVTIELASPLVGLPPARIRRYIRTGLIEPRRSIGRRVMLGPVELARLRRIRRLTDDLGLNMAGVEVTLHLLDIIAAIRVAAPAGGRERSL